MKINGKQTRVLTDIQLCFDRATITPETIALLQLNIQTTCTCHPASLPRAAEYLF